jgi:hypothetical protein
MLAGLLLPNPRGSSFRAFRLEFLGIKDCAKSELFSSRIIAVLNCARDGSMARQSGAIKSQLADLAALQHSDMVLRRHEAACRLAGATGKRRRTRGPQAASQYFS